MQYLTFILAVAAATASAAAVEKRLNFGKWCAGVVNTKGACEDQGFQGYCCNDSQWGPFTENINIAQSPGMNCQVGGDKGVVYCA